MGTKLSDLNAYLQGVQNRLQLVIATNALLLAVAGQLVANFRNQAERLPFPSLLIVLLAAGCLARAIFLAATLAGLHPELRRLLIRRMTITGDSGYDDVSPELQTLMVQEFYRKHQAIRYSRLYLFVGIWGLIAYSTLVVIFSVLDWAHSTHPTIVKPVHDMIIEWSFGGSSQSPSNVAFTILSTLILVRLAFVWATHHAWARFDLAEEAKHVEPSLPESNFTGRWWRFESWAADLVLKSTCFFKRIRK